METELRLDSRVPTHPCGSSLPATSDGTREGLESLQGGVCLTRGMKVLLRVGQSEWGWGASWELRKVGAVLPWSAPLSLWPLLSPGPRGGAAPRKPVSEMPVERDRGAAHSLQPGKENMPGRNEGPAPPFPSLLCSWIPAAFPSPSPSFFRFFLGGGWRGEEGKRGREGEKGMEAK